jgi:hypothetical protein
VFYPNSEPSYDENDDDEPLAKKELPLLAKKELPPLAKHDVPLIISKKNQLFPRITKDKYIKKRSMLTCPIDKEYELFSRITKDKYIKIGEMLTRKIDEEDELFDCNIQENMDSKYM